MKWMVTAFPREPLTQEVVADNGDAAIDLALNNPNNWKIPTPSNNSVGWNYYATPFGDPTQEMLDAAHTL